MGITEEEKNGKVEIIVIGPEPPCVRCLNTFRFAKEAAAQCVGTPISVRKIFSHEEEAQRYGNIEGGHSIAERERVKADADKLQQLIGEIGLIEQQGDDGDQLIANKLGEVDEVLMPIRQKAEEIGSLMTPVLVVNGKVKSSGYVPRKEEIRVWIDEELGAV
jgi:hypothetical protein